MKREAEFDNPVVVDKLSKTMPSKDESEDQVTQFISPNLTRPDKQTQRYDRQLRLWQSLGQRRLSTASILLCDSGATSAQIAKNLALAGVGRLNLFDTETVKQSDIGNNFFLEQSSLGKNRAVACAKYLSELNPSVYMDPNDYPLAEEYGFDYDFEDSMRSRELQVLIGVRLSGDIESSISEICWRYNVPAILVHTCGLAASIEVENRELGVIETHPESLVDMRLDSPFPALSEFARSFEMDKMDNLEHAHIPAVVILVQSLERFKSEHDGKLPQDSAQRQEIKKMILAKKRSSDEDNFDEAVGMIWRACQETKVPAPIEKLFEDKACNQVSKHAPQFWFLVRCLREFVRQNPRHQLPLSGVLPDMKSDTKNYVTLQSIYRQKAQEDLDTFRKIVHHMISSKSLDDPKPEKDAKKPKTEPNESDVKPECGTTGVKSEADQNTLKAETDHAMLLTEEDRKLVKVEEEDTRLKSEPDPQSDPDQSPVKAEYDETKPQIEADEKFVKAEDDEKKPKTEDVEKDESDSDEDKDDDDEDEDKDEEDDEERDEDDDEEKDEDDSDDDDDERLYRIKHITDEEVEIFVKNSAHLRLLRRSKGTLKEMYAKFLEECEPGNEEYTAAWYLGFEALKSFRYSHKGHYPGIEKGKAAEELKALTEMAMGWLCQAGWERAKGVPPKVKTVVEEIMRSAGAELPHISSLVGGMVAQEVIKLATQQYVPLNGVCIFDGYRSSTAVFGH